MKRGTHWPIGIGIALLLAAGGQIWFAIVAAEDPAFAVEGDYYNKAMHWDAEMAQRKANNALGWQIVPTLQLGRGNGDGALSITLHDSAGAAITGAAVDVLAMHNARAARQLSATMTEVGFGAYRAALPAQRPGEWELRFIVRRGGERFTTSERVDVSQN